MNKPTGRQIAAARALLGMSQGELSQAAQISTPTLKRMEASAGVAPGMPNNIDAVVRALELAGVVFQYEGEMVQGGSGVRLNPSILPEDGNRVGKG